MYRTQMKSADGCMMLEIDGSADDIQSAKSEIKQLIAAVKADISVINKIGAGAVFGSSGGKTMLRGLEQMHSSVIEEQHDTDGQPSGHSKRSSKEEPPLATPKRTVPVIQKLSAGDSEGEEGYLLCKEGNVSLRLYRGDITKHKADVLVNTPVAGCEGFSTAGAVAKAFLKVGGKELEQAFSKLSSATLVSTQAYGGLKPVCKQVYHLRISSWSKDTKQDLQKKLNICIKQCATDGFSSIAFPPVGCGNLKYPVSAVAECFKTAVVKHSEGKHTARIAIIAYESGTFRDIHQASDCEDGNSETRPVGIDDVLKASAKLTVVDMLSDNPIERLILRSMVKHELIERIKPKGKQESDSLLLYSKSTFSLFLHRGEITTHRADVLVNTTVAGSKGFVGAVSKAFARAAGGEALEKQYISQSEGTVVATKPCGDLEKVCQSVYHLKLSPWKPDTEKELESQLTACLEKCVSDGFSSIAFPTVGCGGLGYPADKVANSFQKTLDKMSKGKLKSTIVAYESDVYDKFAAFFNGDALDIKVGDWVRVKPGITMPKFGWGSINSKSVGQVVVMASQEATARVFVSFKADNEWKGVVGEMEVVESAGKVSLNVGDTVRLRPEIGTPKYGWGSVSDKSIGKITWIGQDDEGLGLGVKVNFPEQNGWEGLAREMKLVQPSGGSQRFSVGDMVKVKPAIKSPKYGWGSVTAKSVGFVVAMETGGKIRVSYPKKSNWLADAQEMELVVVHFGVECDGCEQCPLAGPRYKCRQCDDFDFCESCFNENSTHRHQFNKISRPGQPAVPLSVTYPEDKSFSAVHGGRQLRPSSKVSNSLVFHVYALTDQAVKDTLKGIHEFLDESLTEDTVKHSKLNAPPQELVKRLQDLSSPRVAVRVDTAARKVVITGVSKDVVGCRREVGKILSSLSEHTYPKYWARQKGKSVFDVDDKVAQIVRTVVEKSWEVQKVGHGRDAIGLGHKTIKVTKVHRIENLKIWEEYQAKRRDYEERAQASTGFPGLGQVGKDVMTRGFGLEDFVKEKTNEVFLFHGTTPQNKDAIIMQGLDSRIGDSCGMFGKGVYFSESSTKADQYTDEKRNRRDGEHHMFLARVLLGNPFVCSKPSKFNRPPCDTCKEELCRNHPDQFDSVIGTHRDSGDELLFREFIVYEKGLCYPEYLITYVRSSN